jgi:hypothetical protein
VKAASYWNLNNNTKLDCKSFLIEWSYHKAPKLKTLVPSFAKNGDGKNSSNENRTCETAGGLR